MEFTPHCPACAAPQNVKFNENPLTSHVDCTRCHQQDQWGAYRIGTNALDPSYNDLRMGNQRLKAFFGAAEARGWDLDYLLAAWRKFGAEGPLAARREMDSVQFGKTIERMMNTEYSREVRFDQTF